MNLFDHKSLDVLFRNLLKEIDVHEEVINNFVPAIIRTSLRGVDSHGINLFPHYYNCFVAGRLNKNPKITFEQKGNGGIVIDADSSIGHHASIVAVKKAMDVAKETGISVSFVKNSTHYGAAFYYAELAAMNGMAAFSFTNADSLVRAIDSSKSFFGTNPFCFSAPMDGEEPMVVDMATSVVSWNKIKNHRLTKTPLNPAWACDVNGKETADADAATMLNPFGGYKGFILGMVVEMLCSFFTNNPAAKEIKPMFTIPLSEKRNIGHCFIVIDINKFISVNDFKIRLANMATQLRSLTALSAEHSPMVPGDPEKQHFKKRIVSGIPVDEAKLVEFLNVSEKFKTVLL